MKNFFAKQCEDKATIIYFIPFFNSPSEYTNPTDKHRYNDISKLYVPLFGALTAL